MKLIFKHLKKHIGKMALLVAFMIAGIKLQLMNAGYIADVVNIVMQSSSGLILQSEADAQLVSVFIRMILIVLGILVTAVVVGRISARIASVVSCDIRQELYDRIMDFSMQEIESLSIPSVITRTTTETVQIKDFLYMMLSTAIQAPFFIIGGLISVVKCQAQMAWTVGLVAGIMIISFVIVCIFSLPIMKVTFKQEDDMNRVAREALSGVQVIRALNRSDWSDKRLSDAGSGLKVTSKKYFNIILAYMPMMYLIIALANVLILWIGAERVDAGYMTVGVVTAYMEYSYMVGMGVILAINICLALPGRIISLNRLKEILDLPITVAEPDEPINVDSNDVEFQNVSFKYKEDGKYVIRDISFRAKQGQTTAIIGNTGCGKSTIVNLIPRLYEAAEGRVLIGGVDVKNQDICSLRAKIGFVPQKVFLFSGTVNSNIAYGGVEVSKDAVTQASQISQSEEFILSHEEKYDYKIARGGMNLSGGQRQRMAIARAIARHPKIYVFDDSFSALDYKTDKIVRNELSKITKDSTVIIVSQRISTIQNADQIVVMHDGEIVGIGTHGELLKNCEMYNEILKSQVSKEEYERQKNVYQVV